MDHSSGEEWLFWQDAARTPAMQMAIDELLLETAAERGGVLCRFYRFDRPTVSFGFAQACPVLPDDRFALVRRPTGGGTVFHDRDFTYSLVIPAGQWLAELPRGESYRVIHGAVLDAVRHFDRTAALLPEAPPPENRRTARCFAHPSRFDVMSGDGVKYAGAAQLRTRHGVLHQGSIAEAAAGGDREALKTALLNSFQKIFEIRFANYSSDAKLIENAKIPAACRYEKLDWSRHAGRH